jgi:hypothetical protein
MGIFVISLGLLRPAELIVKGSLGVVCERYRRFASDDSGGFLSHLLPLQIALKGIKEEPVMRNRVPGKGLINDRREDVEMAVPVEDLLFLLSAYALILEQKIQERRLRKCIRSP